MRVKETSTRNFESIRSHKAMKILSPYQDDSNAILNEFDSLGHSQRNSHKINHENSAVMLDISLGASHGLLQPISENATSNIELMDSDLEDVRPPM